MSEESAPEQASIHLDHLEYLQTSDARQAYLLLLLAGSRAGFATVAKSHPGSKRDVHFEDGTGRPFALIVNREDIRIYLRKPGLGSDASLRARFKTAFQERVTENEGEMAANISDAAEAVEAASILFSAP